MNLDGNDVSSGLVITGSASTKNVVYPALQLNAMHTAIITVTNSLGHGISVTNQFDTFTQTNYMVEAEDFDYDGGQYVSFAIGTPTPIRRWMQSDNIDFQHTIVEGELYRLDPSTSIAKRDSPATHECSGLYLIPAAGFRRCGCA